MNIDCSQSIYLCSYANYPPGEFIRNERILSSEMNVYIYCHRKLLKDDMIHYKTNTAYWSASSMGQMEPLLATGELLHKKALRASLQHQC